MDETRNFRPPSSTYRLQLRSGLTLKRLVELADYFSELGVSHLYLSPILRADSSSPHGYAVVDFNDIDPRIGRVEEIAELAEALRRRDMGILLDVVSNHMSASPVENRWWRDVLEMGPRSPFARYFDIDWNQGDPDLQGRVLLPVLTETLPEALEKGLTLTRGLDGLFVSYRRRRFPLAPRTWPDALSGAAGDSEFSGLFAALDAVVGDGADPLSPEAWREKELLKEKAIALLHRSESTLLRVDRALSGVAAAPEELRALLAKQSFLLSHFREATRRINYRRFFDINDLVALRVEDPEVFEVAHAFLFALMEQGWIAGLRIDHIDGLQDPKTYLERLPHGRFVVVEKVLEEQERLPADWPVAGTTGYEVLNRLQRLFVSPSGYDDLAALFDELTGRREVLEDVIHRSKLDALDASFPAEVRALATRLVPLLRADGGVAVRSLAEVEDALRELIACFPVYRTYLRPGVTEMEEWDWRILGSATSQAKRRLPQHEKLLDLVSEVLRLGAPAALSGSDEASRIDAALRFQQLTGPAMAKGVEDTAFYRYYPLVALNEVGGGPSDLAAGLDEFHERNRERAARWRFGLTATSTHDTKRDEDVRARILVLSEIPTRWREAVARWRRWNERHKRSFPSGEAPHPVEEYLLYQTLLGTWPLAPMDASSHRDYVERIESYMVKALREAKQHTSWIDPDEAYEKAVTDFVGELLDTRRSLRFLDDFGRFELEARGPGLLNALSQTLLKATIPGVPDFYQGTELWSLRLVDPDNRRPIDWELRRKLLGEIREEVVREGAPAFLERALGDLDDGRLKLYLTWRALRLRRDRFQLFAEGSYLPLEVRGTRSEHAIAFARAHESEEVVVAAARFYTRLPRPPIGEPAWDATFVSMPPRPHGKGLRYRELLSGRIVCGSVVGGEPRLPLAQAFRHLPLAILEPTQENE